MSDSSAQPTTRLGKVSIIASDLSSSGAGRWKGAVRPFLLAAALKQLGYTVEILGFIDDPSKANFATDMTVKALAGGTYPRFFRSAQQLMTQLDGNIIYAYKLKPSSFGVALLNRWWTQRPIPIILDIDDWELSWHGGDQGSYPESWRQVVRDVIKPDGALRQPDHPLYLRWIEHWVDKADAITLHTKFLQKRFGGHYIPNGKDTDLFDPDRYDPEASRAKYGLAGYKVLMFPGAPRPHKGIEDILTALDQLNQPDYRVVIVGGSPYDNYDQALMQRWGRWIIQLPKYSYDQMPEVVSAAHAVVVPQRNSPIAQAQFPLKLTDGMALAKPVLATRVGDIPDILADTGYLVEPDSPHQLAEALKSMFSSFSAAEAKGKRARERCIRHYSITAMATELKPILERLTQSDAVSNAMSFE
ncbi:glycosyltransferase family 4 protein [Romeria aff. gracilis LEGE 07310]|uniref:Glycosyltransferase family 4 protein n=1 Tax=Vasconcelosia minhoensis LEGE 07310 TaxID=915328 RepID=A0A8J7AVS9_9CYAN|nr:glycosyltransferase family 4 protein [Romeria gracilis]MBE9076602.1 glycosyltransferase family 4 protein [Romeria aff. gracilis LEGE 07310]